LSEESVCLLLPRDGVEIFYKAGVRAADRVQPWLALSADDWDNQMMFFLGKAYRVIAHDRTWGMGASTQVADGHDMDHYADDLAALTAHLGLKDCDPCWALDRRW